MSTSSIAAASLLLLSLATAPAISHAAPVAPTAAQAALIRKIEGRLMAPCCYTQTILDHQSDVAVQMRNEVTAMVTSGKSETEIINYYRKAYGETILVVPDGLSGRLLTYTPVLLFLTATGLLFFAIRRLAAFDVAVSQVATAESFPELSRLREMIRRDTAGDC
jgi:cytochrome c-type biogenesis protein CcmH/NrfF